MYANPKTEAMKNTNDAMRYKASGRLFRIFKWVGAITAIIPPVTMLMIMIYASLSFWSALSITAYFLNPPLIVEIFFTYLFFPMIIIGIVVAIVSAIFERKMNKKAKWCGDIAYYLHLYERNNSYENAMNQLQADIDEAIRTANYARERHLQAVQVEVKEILRTVPQSNKQTKSCTQCGTHARPEDVFCKNCGKQIN